jgi:hypothetical protein
VGADFSEKLQPPAVEATKIPEILTISEPPPLI